MPVKPLQQETSLSATVADIAALHPIDGRRYIGFLISIGLGLGAVLLLDEVVDGQAVTSLAGTDQGNRGVLTLESPEVAEEIARHVAVAMLNRLEPSRLVLGPLDTNDPRVHAFASTLPGAQLVAVDPIPVIEQVEPDARAYLSQGMRRTLRKAKNRLDKDGHEMTVLFTKCPHEIGSVVPQLEQVHRDRDHVHGRRQDHRPEQERHQRVGEDLATLVTKPLHLALTDCRLLGGLACIARVNARAHQLARLVGLHQFVVKDELIAVGREQVGRGIADAAANHAASSATAAAMRGLNEMPKPTVAPMVLSLSIALIAAGMATSFVPNSRSSTTRLASAISRSPCEMSAGYEPSCWRVRQRAGA